MKIQNKGTNIERRNAGVVGSLHKPSDLPVDYLRLVEETLTNTFEKGLKELEKHQKVNKFSAWGAVYSDEILLTATLYHGPEQLAATTFYASVDYTPGQEKPTLELLLSTCLDGVGGAIDFFLNPENPERIEQIAGGNLGLVEEAPFDWCPEDFDGIKVYVKMDKTNPLLEGLTEEWLRKHDPTYRKNKAEDAAEAEEFFGERVDTLKRRH